MSIPGKSPFTAATQTRVRRYAERRGILAHGDSVLVAVSGGADSTALLLILYGLASKLGLALHAAHFDHRLRDRAETAADRAAVEALCRDLNIPLVCGSGDVAGRARRRKETTEEAARNLRYAFLGKEAKRVGASVVAVGHTMDDRAETVLLHILRGSGLDGLAAMPPLASWPFGRGPSIARPLLELTRVDTERYCKEAGIEPREDRTNAVVIATRNRIRHELLPVLRGFNPRVTEALSRLAESASQDAAFLDDETRKTWRRLATPTRHSVSFDRDAFAALSSTIQHRLLRRAGVHLKAEAATAAQLTAVLEGLIRPRNETSLPGNVTATSDAKTLAITRLTPFT